MNNGIERLLPVKGFRGGEYLPMWADKYYRVYGLQRKHFIAEAPGKFTRTKDVSKDLSGAYGVNHAVVLNDFVYIKCVSPEGSAVIRYNCNDLTLPGTVMTFVGQGLGTKAYDREYMTCDGTHFYFTYKAGHAKDEDHVISKYKIAGSQLLYVNDIICGDDPKIFDHILVLPDETIYAFHSLGFIRKFNGNGAKILMCRPCFNAPRIHNILVIAHRVYVHRDQYYQLIDLE